MNFEYVEYTHSQRFLHKKFYLLHEKKVKQKPKHLLLKLEKHIIYGFRFKYEPRLMCRVYKKQVSQKSEYPKYIK
jgi:hypothetical protein